MAPRFALVTAVTIGATADAVADLSRKLAAASPEEPHVCLRIIQ